MALIKCSECGKEISDTSKICPNCGIEIKNNLNETNELKIKLNSIDILISINLFHLNYF